MQVKCHYCAEIFTPKARDQELTIAWLNTSRKKGANAPVVRHRFHLYAHGDCVRQPGQGKILIQIPDLEGIL